ncbi:hypothetical protein H5T55_01825 [Candidatus Bipolaricaulota bacterium]|nr:hypothetical protein [Candidatus Bipolaricaulota bacterium]
MGEDWVCDLFIEHGDLFQAHGIGPEATVLDLSCGIGEGTVRHFAPSGVARVGDLLLVEERKWNLEYRDFERREASLESARLLVVAENPEGGEE